jgi:hypothetical protein
LQWLHHPCEIYGDSLNNIRCEARRHLKEEERISERQIGLPKNSKNKNIRDLYRGINELKSGYQHRTNVHTVHTWMKLLGVINISFDVTDKILIRYFAFVRC